jgi:peptidyl-prolyl cis-trans isomerase C
MGKRIGYLIGLALAVSLLFGGIVKDMMKEAKSLESKGFYEEAENLLEKALNEKPSKDERFEILIELADIEFDKLEKPKEALEHLKEAKALYPDRHRKMDEVYYRLGLVYEKLGRYVDAAKAFEAVATKFRKSKYFSDALDGVERVFKKNFREYVAIVGDEPITRLEFDERLEEIPSFFRAQYETEEGRKKLLDRMIDEILLTKEAEARKIYLKAEVRKELEKQRRKILQSALYNEAIRERLEIPESEIKKYYKKNKKEFELPAKANVRRIVVKERKKAEEILEMLKKGAPFDSLAKEFSIAPDANSGGLMANITPNSKPSAIAKLAFKLKEGEISPVITLEDSTFAIIKVEKKEPPRIKPLEDVRDQIVRVLKREKEKELWESFRKELREKYGVKYEEEIKSEMKKYIKEESKE